MPELRTPFAFEPAQPRSVGTGDLASAKIVADIRRIRLQTVKRVILALASIVTGAAIGVTWNAAFMTGTITLASLAVTLLFTAFLPLVALALKWHTMAITNLLATFFMVAPFFGMISNSLLVALWLAMAFIAILASASSQWRSHLYLSFSMAVYAGAISLLVLGFSILFTGLHYGTALASRGEAAPQFFVSERVIAVALSMSQGVAQRFFPWFRAEMSVGEYLDSAIEGRKDAILAELKNESMYQRLSAAEKRQLETAVLARARQAMLEKLSSALGKSVNEHQSLVSFLHDYLTERLLRISPEVQRAMIFPWLVLVFLGVWSIGAIAKLIITIVAWILLQLLLGLRLFEIRREQAERKYLALT